MSEPTGHCPYLGLKQNRAIRFSTPTPEHRCYVGGDPIEIPVDQSSYCLSAKHMQCPLYMGLTAPTTTSIRTPPVTPAQPNGLRGWLASLSPRDRTIYAVMIGILAMIMLIYLAVGIQSLLGAGPLPSADAPTPIPASPSSTQAAPTATRIPPTPTIPPPPTPLPTGTSEPLPSPRPTQAPIIIPPTLAATETPQSATASPTAPAATPTQSVATATLPAATATAPAATRPPATAVPATPTLRPATAVPTSVPATAAPPATATQPPAAVRRERLWLYFGDTTGTLYVPVQRAVDVVDQQVATAAVQELIAGPRDGLYRLVNAETRLLGVQIAGGTATVNLDRDPSNGDYERALYSIVLSLTHFPSVERVQFQINGANIGIGDSGPLGRPVVNPLNPLGLPVDFATTEFLPLYFLSNDGHHSVRIIRMVPKTNQTASGTVQALIEGPGEYGYAVYRTIPEGTSLRGVSLENGIATVDFSSQFAEAANRNASVRSVVESLTTLSTIRGVRFEVEGRSLGEWWGAPYGDVYLRPAINPE